MTNIIESDIEKLRTEVQRLKRVLRVSLLIMMSCFLLGATSLATVPNVIQAKKFEVINEEGKSVVELTSYQGGGVIFNRDKNENPTFLLANERTKTGVSYGSLAVINERGKPIITLGSTVNGQGMVTTNGVNGNPLVKLGAGDGGGMISTNSDTGKTLVHLTITGDGSGAVVTKDKTGKISGTQP